MWSDLHPVRGRRLDWVQIVAAKGAAGVDWVQIVHVGGRDAPGCSGAPVPGAQVPAPCA